MADFNLKNINIYNTELKKFMHGEITVSDGIITNITADSEERSGDMYIIPGMVDIHTHGRAGFDFTHASSAEVERMCQSYASVGTTTVFATLATAPLNKYKEAIANIKTVAESDSINSAKIYGIHFEGRYLNPSRRGAHNENMLVPLVAEEIAELVDMAKPLKSRVTAAPELDGGEQFVKSATEHGAFVSIGHSDSTYDEAMRILEWGAVSFTHLFNAMKPIHHREPGTVGAALTSDAYVELICDGFHLHPAVVKLAYLAKCDKRILLITDSMEATGCPDGTYEIGSIPVIVKNGQAINIEGVIAGSTLNLFDGVKNMAEFCGLSIEEVIPFATANPAAMVGIDDKVGKLAEGMRADFLILDNDKKTLVKTYVNGNSIE
jgi:N-acetylglucosamine-6-phosphate deacetylase